MNGDRYILLGGRLACGDIMAAGEIVQVRRPGRSKMCGGRNMTVLKPGHGPSRSRPGKQRRPESFFHDHIAKDAQIFSLCRVTGEFLRPPQPSMKAVPETSPAFVEGIRSFFSKIEPVERGSQGSESTYASRDTGPVFSGRRPQLGQYALMMNVSYGEVYLARLLLAAGLGTNIGNNDGETALQMAGNDQMRALLARRR